MEGRGGEGRGGKILTVRFCCQAILLPFTSAYSGNKQLLLEGTLHASHDSSMTSDLLHHGDEDLEPLSQLYHQAAQRFHGSGTEVWGLVQHTDDGVDDLRGVVAEVQRVAQLLDGLQSRPAVGGASSGGRGRQ